MKIPVKMNELTMLDLFSGIGGFSLGFQRAGYKFKRHYYSEINKHSIAVYNHNFKNSEYVGAIEAIQRGKLKRPNLVTFGFPCQDLSVAGNGAGLGGRRSGLFFEAVDLIKYYKPEIFVFENVKGLLSRNKGKEFETVLRTIADIGLYDCEWQLLDTRWLLPQSRERVYFVGHLRGGGTRKVFPFTEADKEFARNNQKNPVKRIDNDGNSRPQGYRVYFTDGISPGLNIWTRGVSGNSILIKEVNPEVSYCISSTYAKGKLGKGRGTLIGNEGGIRKLTEIECERLQGFPDNWTKFGDYNGVVKEVAKTNRYEMIGNAVTSDIVEMIANRLK